MTEEKKVERTAVRVVEKRGKSVVVQWLDGDLLRRSIVNASAVEGNEIDSKLLGKSPEVGINWAKKVQMERADELERIMRNRGLFTPEDLQKNLGELTGAFIELFRDEILALRLVKEG